MAKVRLAVLYPYPKDVDAFNQDYEKHLELLHERMLIPKAVKPYTVTRFIDLPQGRPVYYLMFSLPFPSAQALNEALGNPAMKEVAEDSVRISSGGPPVILVGADEE